LAKRRLLRPAAPAVGVDKRFQPFRTQQSAVHPLSSFVDVGEDDVFHSSRRWIVDSYCLQPPST
jgi:hypothetical protein